MKAKFLNEISQVRIYALITHVIKADLNATLKSGEDRGKRVRIPIGLKKKGLEQNNVL